MWIKAATFFGIATLVPTGAHFMVLGAAKVDQAAVGFVDSQKQSVVNNVANYFGFEPRKATDDASLEQRLDDAALKFVIAPNLMHCVAKTESNFDQDAESFVGAVGPMQVMPANFKRCGLRHKEDLLDDETNAMCGGYILSDEIKNGKSLRTGLKLYNCGASNLKKNPACGDRYAEGIINCMARNLR